MAIKTAAIRLAKAIVRGTWRTPADFVRDILRDTRCVAADVGAARGLQYHWLPLEGNATLYCFEPCAAEAAALQAQCAGRTHSDRYRVIPCALSNTSGVATLHVTNTPTGSSLKYPHSSLCDGYAPADYFFPLREEQIDVRRFDEALDAVHERDMHFIKLDTQGCEYDILCGLGDARRGKTFCVEAEVNLVGAIQGGTEFGKLADLLTQAGLEFFDMRLSRSYRLFPASSVYGDVFGVTACPKSIAARAWEADVVWFRKPESILSENTPDAVRILLVAYCLYNFFTEAWHLLDLAETRRPSEAAEWVRLRSVIKEWHRYIRRLFPVDRPVVARLLKRRQRWHQYTWLPYPNS